MDACAKVWVDPLLGSKTAPDPGLAKSYAALFPHYVDARKAVQPAWHGLRDIRAARAQ
jgi:erythritol kinase